MVARPVVSERCVCFVDVHPFLCVFICPNGIAYFGGTQGGIVGDSLWIGKDVSIWRIDDTWS